MGRSLGATPRDAIGSGNSFERSVTSGSLILIIVMTSSSGVTTALAPAPSLLGRCTFWLAVPRTTEPISSAWIISVAVAATLPRATFQGRGRVEVEAAGLGICHAD